MPEIEVVRAGARHRIILDAPRGNAITDAMVGALSDAIHAIPAGTKLITLEAAGHDFSFGSSLEEHAPARMREVLPRFLALVSDWLRIPVVTAAVVSGRCLGGGFELALACDFIFASDDATLGLPEIKVAAFPPIGSILLPLRVGTARATSAMLTGEPRPALAWQEAGLIERVARHVSLEMAVSDWYDSTVARYSSAALARAVRASRLSLVKAFSDLLPAVQSLYLDDLLSTEDSSEGIRAFLEKRTPVWKDR